MRWLLFSSEAHRDAELGGGQRDRGVEGEAGRGQTDGGAQKVAFTQTQRETINEAEVQELGTQIYVLFPVSVPATSCLMSWEGTLHHGT